MIFSLSALLLSLLLPAIGGVATDPGGVSPDMPPVVNEETANRQLQPQVVVPLSAALVFDRQTVHSTPAPLPAPKGAPVPSPDEPDSPVPTPSFSPSPVEASSPITRNVLTAPVVPAARTVNVGLQGGQDVVDLGLGPVLFPLGAGFPPYVAEHDYRGGWAEFGDLQAGMKVTMTGLVTGTYTVGKIIIVPNPSTTTALAAFGDTPKVMLQTCIPNTNSMMVVGLY